jgi:hypothetical protein
MADTIPNTNPLAMLHLHPDIAKEPISCQGATIHFSGWVTVWDMEGVASSWSPAVVLRVRWLEPPEISNQGARAARGDE